MSDTKTPEQIADSITQELRGYRDNVILSEAELIAALRRAIEADRAQWFDTAGSASSQHFIETGRYLLHEEVAEMEALNPRPDAPTPTLREHVAHVQAVLGGSAFFSEDGTEALVVTGEPKAYIVSVNAEGNTSSATTGEWETGYDA